MFGLDQISLKNHLCQASVVFCQIFSFVFRLQFQIKQRNHNTDTIKGWHECRYLGYLWKKNKESVSYTYTPEDTCILDICMLATPSKECPAGGSPCCGSPTNTQSIAHGNWTKFIKSKKKWKNKKNTVILIWFGWVTEKQLQWWCSTCHGRRWCTCWGFPGPCPSSPRPAPRPWTLSSLRVLSPRTSWTTASSHSRCWKQWGQ